MSKGINKIKITIHKKIDQLNDETVLQMLEEAVTVYSSSSRKDILDELTPEQQKRLNESIKQAEEGNTISDEDVKQKAREWLSK
jgi:gas vesicle protein